MEEYEELDDLGLFTIDYNQQDPADPNANPPRRYVPYGQPRRSRVEVRNSLDAALRLRRHRALTSRDYLLLRTLLMLGIMSTHQIQRLFWPQTRSSVVVTNRMRKLYHRHCINHPPECREFQMRNGLLPGYTYTLGKVGAAALYLRYGVNRKRMSERKRYQIGRGAPLMFHDLMVAETYVKLQETMRTLAGTTVWYNEEMGNIMGSDGRELVRPDGTMTLRFNEQQLSLAFELDRGKTVWPDKIDAYERAYDRQLWRKVAGDTPYLDGVLVVVVDRYFNSVIEQIQQTETAMPYFIKRWSTLLTTPFFDEWYASTEGRSCSLLTQPTWQDVAADLPLE